MTPPTPRTSRRSRGFTLIELLVVIGIIGLLVSLTVTVIPRVRRAAYGAATGAQLSALANAIQQYYGDFRAYPGPLANGQLGATYYAAPQTPSIIDPNNSNAVVHLTFAGCDTAASNNQQVTGAENLVLGLLGGLEFTYNGTAAGSPITAFQYNSLNLFPDGTTPAPKGPLVLNPNAPKRFGAYIQVKAGDLSNSRTVGTTPVPTFFTDEAGRPAADSPIPEFLDKFSKQMPILFLRANVGGTAVVGLGGSDTLHGTPLADSTTTLPVVPQYDLAQCLAYTGSKVGTLAGSTTLNQHGLQGLGNAAFGTAGTADTVTTAFPNNACVYLKDPNLSAYNPTASPTLTNTHLATARQKDAFLLISAGPDGIYGTADDIIYPGGSVAP